MARALVTGGAGFVGRWMVRRLLADGLDVVSVDSLLPSGGGLRPDPEFLQAHAGRLVFHEEDCRSYFDRCNERFDYVFHLAAVVGGRSTIENRPIQVADDLSIDAHLWNWCAMHRPGRVIYFSSSAAYPIKLQTEQNQTILSEDMISFDDQLSMPDLSYGWTKLSGEYLARLYIERYDGDAIMFRPFSGYGEDQDNAYPFPAICRRMRTHQGDPVVNVWGSGRQCRDFIHISDCVDFISRSFPSAKTGTTLNLSTGIPTSFVDMATEICRQLGWSPQIVGTSQTPEGVFFRCGDTALQRQHGLIPSVSLSDGIARMLDHLQQAGQDPDAA